MLMVNLVRSSKKEVCYMYDLRMVAFVDTGGKQLEIREDDL